MGHQAQLRLHQVMQQLLQPVPQVAALQVVDLPAVVHPVVVDRQVAALRVVDLQVEVRLVAVLQVAALQVVVHLVVAVPQVVPHLVAAVLQVAHLVAVFQAALQVLESRVVLQVAR